MNDGDKKSDKKSKSIVPEVLHLLLNPRNSEAVKVNDLMIGEVIRMIRDKEECFMSFPL